MTLLLLIFTLALSLIIIDLHNWVLLRLLKEAEFRDLLFTLRTWRLPSSNRYKTYGEAKKRMREILRNGTPKEKLAVYTLTAAQFSLLAVIVILLLMLTGTLQFITPLFPISPILLAVLLLILGSQRFVWKTIA